MLEVTARGRCELRLRNMFSCERCWQSPVHGDGDKLSENEDLMATDSADISAIDASASWARAGPGRNNSPSLPPPPPGGAQIIQAKKNRDLQISFLACLAIGDLLKTFIEYCLSFLVHSSNSSFAATRRNVMSNKKPSIAKTFLAITDEECRSDYSICILNSVPGGRERGEGELRGRISTDALVFCRMQAAVLPNFAKEILRVLGL